MSLILTFLTLIPFSEKEVEVGTLQTEVREKALVIHEISRIAKVKDQEIENLDSQLAGKQSFTCD